MAIEKISFSDEPSKITEFECDCLCVLLSARTSPEPTKNVLIEHLDWKLRGQISKLLAEGSTQKTAFIHGEDLGAKLVGVQSVDSLDFEFLEKNFEGMKMKQVGVLLENFDQLSELSSGLTKLSQSPHFTVQVLTEKDLLARS